MCMCLKLTEAHMISSFTLPHPLSRNPVNPVSLLAPLLVHSIYFLFIYLSGSFWTQAAVSFDLPLSKQMPYLFKGGGRGDKTL